MDPVSLSDGEVEGLASVIACPLTMDIGRSAHTPSMFLSFTIGAGLWGGGVPVYIGKVFSLEESG